MSPLNRSTDSILSRHVVSSEPAATAAAVTEGNRATCSITARKSCTVVAPLQPFQVPLGLLLRSPAARSGRTSFAGRQIAGEMAAVLLGPVRDGDVDRLQLRQGSAGWRPRSGASTRPGRRTARSAPGACQSAAKTSRMPPRTEISPGSSTAEVLWKPRSASHAESSRTSNSVPDAKRAGVGRQRLDVGHRLHQGLDARHQERRRLGARQAL